MPVKLDDDKIKYVICEKENGTPNATIAESMKISPRHVTTSLGQVQEYRLAANDQQWRPA